MTPEDAKQYLTDHNYIELPAGSYFRWIQKDRFEAYKNVLSFRNGAWIPKFNKLAELGRLEEIFKMKDWKEYGAEQHDKEEIESLVQTQI